MSQDKGIIIIGAGGRMGGALVRHYGTTHKVHPFRRAELDVARTDSIRPALASHDFDTVIFTAGTTNVDYCEDHPEEARLTNAEAPRELAEVCRERGARFIHVSTDYVFEGTDEGLRKESDPAEPINVYGRSKLEGERAVLNVSEEFLVIRVSWLFGPDRPAFPDMILKQALEKERVQAISDKWSCPTYSEDLAEWMRPMLFDNRYRGVLHLSNTGCITWQEFGQRVLDVAAQRGLPLKTRTVEPLSRIGFAPFKAERPAHTGFDTERFHALSGITPRNWEDAVEEYVARQYCGAK
jgi:dTDP-4-dehydrorhamnose reductase